MIRKNLLVQLSRRSSIEKPFFARVIRSECWPASSFVLKLNALPPNNMPSPYRSIDFFIYTQLYLKEHIIKKSSLIQISERNFKYKMITSHTKIKANIIMLLN